MHNYTVLAHIIYLLLSLCLTIWVSRTLFKQGAVFIKDAFGGDKSMSQGLSRLLQMGFYLMAFGFICFYLRAGDMPTSIVALVEQVSTKVGLVLMILALLHFGNLFNFAKIRRKSRRQVAWAGEEG